jgi:hypothetical protein
LEKTPIGGITQRNTEGGCENSTISLILYQKPWEILRFFNIKENAVFFKPAGAILGISRKKNTTTLKVVVSS